MQHHKESVFSKNFPVCLVTGTIYTFLGNMEIIMEAPLEGLSLMGVMEFKVECKQNNF